MSFIRGRFFFLFFLFFVTSSFSQTGHQRESAWVGLVRQNPAAVDDPELGWKERLVLYALTPNQVQDYYRGVEPDSILLDNGETLRQYLDRKTKPVGNLYYPLPTLCPLFSVETMTSVETLALKVRGEDLSRQGGSPSGCGVPNDASAVMIQMRVQSSADAPVRVKLWAMDGPEPAESLMVSVRENSDSTMVVVPLNQSRDPEGANIQVSGSDWSAVDGQLVGYFRRLDTENRPGNGVSFYVESNSFNQNDFFGWQTGAHTTWGEKNAFFGRAVGYSNTTGSSNSFFGALSGYSNKGGYRNSFFGTESGYSNTEGIDNSFFGISAGYSNTEGIRNSFFGMTAGYSNTKGNYNSSFGVAAGGDNKIGSNNAFFGYQAGMKTTTSENSFFGSLSGYSNTSGVYNSFYGSRSGYSNTTGRENAFFGRDSGYFNTTGSSNSIFGFGAGYRNTAGKHNSFFGWGAGTSNTTGNFNSFFGSQAGYSNTEGRDNAFFGYQAGKSNTTGDSNTFSGLNAGIWNTLGRENTFIGKGAGQANTVESYNTMIGGYATAKRIVNPTDSPVENATAVGNRAYVTQSNSLVLGSINGFNGATVDVDVGIGVPAPSAPMHILRKDGNARILVEERATTPEVRTMLELQNNGGARITLKNTEKKTAWIFSTNNLDQFYFSRAGTTGAEVLLDPSGRLMVGPGSKTVFDLDPTGNLKIKGDLTANGVVYSSDRDLKENLVIINSQVMLEKLVSVPVSEWNFKRQDTRHIGPMAQDFYAAFGVGKDDKHLNPTDTAGVTIAAIQGLYQQVQDQNARMKEQLLDKDREISNLKAELKTVNQNLTEIRMLLGLTRLN